MLVKTLKRHRYDGQIHEQDSEYEIAPGKHLRLLEAVGRIRRMPAVIVAPPKEEPKTVTVKKAVKKKASKKTSKNTYSHKAMVSE